MYLRIKHSCIGLGVVLLLIFLFIKTTSINAAEHNYYTQHLRRLKELQANLSKHVLESYYGSLTTYDYVNEDFSRLQDLQSELKSLPSFLQGNEKVEMQKLLQDYAVLLDKEGKLLEQFKSKNAILNNSLRYFPAATKKVLAQSKNRYNLKENVALANLLQAVLIYYLPGNQISEENINQQIQALLEAQPASNTPTASETQVLLLHAKVILQVKPELDQLLSGRMDSSTSELVEKINHQYGLYYQQAQRSADLFGAVLFGVSVALLLYIGYIIIKLNQATRALHATNETLEQRVKKRTAQLTASNQELEQSEANNKALIQAIPDSLLRFNKEGICLNFVPGRGLNLTASGSSWNGHSIFEILPTEVADKMMLQAQQSLETNKSQVDEFQLIQGNRIQYYESRIVGCGDSDVLTIIRDISEQKFLLDQLQRAQKLESIGQLAAGVAHEINTPTQYVGDNTRFVKDSFAELETILEAFIALLDSVHNGEIPPALFQQAEQKVKLPDIKYLREEIPRALQESLEGLSRITKIVQSMKEFAHPGTVNKTAVNLNQAIESTISIARNEWKYIADMETDFASDLPLVPCLVGEFNQVILNLIINATHTIADVIESAVATKGLIKISTRCKNNWVEIRISDSGTGIPEAVRGKIFDPFFTTKEVGKGTGQGLAISHAVIVEKHGGQLTFETEIGKGTTFIIRLPINAAINPAPQENPLANE